MTRDTLRGLAIQLPFLLWLIALWMMLLAQFTVLSLVTGLIVAIVVTRLFRLPTVELSGRINLGYLLLFAVLFLGAVVRGALSVAVQVFDFRRPPGTAIVAVPLRYADDLIMTHVSVASSLIPGSLVVESDRDRRILYLHVIGVRSRKEVERQRQGVLRWERRIVRAVGSRAQHRALRDDERSGEGPRAGSRADRGPGQGAASGSGRGAASGPGSGAGSGSGRGAQDALRGESRKGGAR